MRKKRLENSFLERLRTFLLTAVLALLFLISINTLSVYAETYASKWAWRDDLGNIYVKVEDRQRTSKIYYETVGFTITRCLLGTKEPIEDQYITVRFTDVTEPIDLGNGQIGTAFLFKEGDLLSEIAIRPDWLADVQGGDTCYLIFDAIMVTVNENYSEEERYSGYMLSDDNQNYIENIYNPHPGVYDKFNIEELKSVYGWAQPGAIDTHFGIALLYNGGFEEEPIASDEFIGTTGKSKPSYYTWNNSDEFDLSEGIPSGENITNGYGADKWYGNYTVGLHEVTKSYNLSYDFIYHTYTPTYAVDEDGDYEYDDDGNKIQTGVSDNVYHIPKVYKVTRKASYYYLLGVNLYELSEAEIANSVYPGDVLKYSSISGEIPMEILKDGVSNPVSVSNWTSDEEKHVKFPDAHTSTITIDCGEGYRSVEAKISHLDKVLYDDTINEEDYIKGVKSWNDLVEVNGVKYMDNEIVEHANDTSKVRIKYKEMTNGKDDAMYVFSEEQKTVTIPTNVANGSYATSMDVLYKRRVLNDNYIMAFSTTDAGDSIYNHLKPGYEKNEPVYVHTPVISPVTIVNGEETTQLITENLTNHTGLVNKDGRTPDNKAIAELILDNEYTIHWDSAAHREIQGYGDSGTPSKYDEYVNDKWVRFPFEVQMHNQFFKVSDDGYTEWIRLEKDEYLNFSFYVPPWAKESTYYEIEYKVEAYNVDDESGVNHGDDQQPEYNDLNDPSDKGSGSYVAYYVLPVELSGIIYNFEVIGSQYC